MEITTRSLWTMIHGMGFGALYLLACSGALVDFIAAMCRRSSRPSRLKTSAFSRIYLVVMAVVAWLTVLTGAYIIYPWYRAVPPAGTVEPGRISAASAHVESRDQRLALHRHGVEGAHRVARAHLHHHGSRGLRAPRPQSEGTTRTALRRPQLCLDLADRCRHCRLFRRHDQQERARRRRRNHSHCRREKSR